MERGGVKGKMDFFLYPFKLQIFNVTTFHKDMVIINGNDSIVIVVEHHMDITIEIHVIVSIETVETEKETEGVLIKEGNFMEHK